MFDFLQWFKPVPPSDGVYRAHGPKLHSPYWINYEPATPRGFAKALKKVFRLNPESAVIDGDDDWYAPHLMHPKAVAEFAGIPVVAQFHSGISGMCNSGIVIDGKHLTTFENTVKELSKREEWVKGRSSKMLSVFEPGKKMKVVFAP